MARVGRDANGSGDQCARPFVHPVPTRAVILARVII